MAATTKLTVYNGALREIGAAPLADLVATNTKLYELNQAYDHAVEHVLAMEDWGFARRRATLTGVSDSAFPPYTFRFTKPADYLRKCWIKTSAADEYQVDHAEIAAVFYAQVSSGLLEYVSDHADNYDPANWPPHFTRVLELTLASRVAEKLARAGAGDVGMLDGKLQSALAEAKDKESLFLVNGQIPIARQPVMRRALEFIGQQMAGSVALHAQADMLRWHMNRSWDHAVKYVLEQGAWNFATRRAILTGGTEDVPGDTLPSIVEGYVLPPATATTPANLPDASGYSYGYPLPSDFLHKIWCKADANHDLECDHQFIGTAIFTRQEPVVLEYVALDADSTNPATWSAVFLEAVAAYLALLVVPELRLEEGRKSLKFGVNELRGRIEQVFMGKLQDAKLRDAIQQQAARVPLGRFMRARFGSVGTTSIRRYN
jgi:hypothetical protein